MLKRFSKSIWIIAACLTLMPQASQAQPGESSTTAPDPLPVNSVWVNESLNLTLTVLERKGKTFRGKLVAGAKVERTFTGTVVGKTVAWAAKDVEAVIGGQGGDNTGIIDGDRIDFEYRTNADSGKFTLRRRDARASREALPTLDESTFERWRDYIRPASEELGWMKIGWQPSLAQAVVQGQQHEKPILVWAMSGNPLGCT